MYQEADFRAVESAFESPIAQHIWRDKYRYKSKGRVIDRHVRDTWDRVSRALAVAEKSQHRSAVQAQFFDAMSSYRLLPAGRIMAGGGTARNVTLANTFVMRTIPDSVAGIMDTAKQAALTMQMGGGIGFDFSTIRPKGAYVGGLDCAAAGPLAAMDICDAVCKMVVTGMGRGAMMATLRCDHPDIEAFVRAKSDPARLRNFNISVLVTDTFMTAVRNDDLWELKWNGWTLRSLRARALWDTIMRANYEAAEPGVLFIDRINALNPLNYLETISSTNSCAEQPLPPNGTCPLASINLARLVRAPFRDDARFDYDELRRLSTLAVRLLDNAIDVSRFAVAAQRKEAQSKRRIGVGVTGVGDALIMLGLRYGAPKAAEQVGRWMQILQNAAYLASANLAAERGTFPLYDGAKHQTQPTIQKLDPETRRAILQHGLRNGALTTIAPTGTVSMYAGNVSSGIEPVFATGYKRAVTGPDGTKTIQTVEDYAVALYRMLYGPDADLPKACVTAMELTPSDHVAMQAAAQEWVDTGISKTVNCPDDISFEDFQNVYMQAYDSGCKGCTTFRPNDVTGSILTL